MSDPPHYSPSPPGYRPWPGVESRQRLPGPGVIGLEYKQMDTGPSFKSRCFSSRSLLIFSGSSSRCWCSHAKHYIMISTPLWGGIVSKTCYLFPFLKQIHDPFKPGHPCRWVIFSLITLAASKENQKKYLFHLS